MVQQNLHQNIFAQPDWQWLGATIIEMRIDTYFSCVTYRFLQVVDVILDFLVAILVLIESFLDAVFDCCVPTVTVHEGYDSYGDLRYQDNQQEHCKLNAHLPHFRSATDGRCGGIWRNENCKGKQT
jgi:hypothetical protein